VGRALKRWEEKSKTTKQSQRENFDQLVLEAIDEGLSSLGETGKGAIYFHLEGRFNIKKQEIPYKLNDFMGVLKRIFGYGARHFEVLFIKKLHAKLEATFKLPPYKWPSSMLVVPEMAFTEYVNLMRESYETANDEKVEIGVLMNEHEELQK
jgi:hypothetical protein